MIYFVMFVMLGSAFFLTADISKDGGPGFKTLLALIVILSGIMYLVQQ